MANSKESKGLREPYTTSIKSDLLHKLRVYCAVVQINQNVFLEKLLNDFFEKEEGVANGNFDTNKTK